MSPTSPLDPTAAVTVEDAIDWPKLRAAWVAQLGIDPGSDPTGVGRVSLCRCHHSQLQFFWPLSIAAPPAFYSRLETFPWYYRAAKWDYTRALECIEITGRLLDVGCGVGHFLALAQRAGLTAEGLELNEHAANTARTAGYDVSTETIEQAAERAPGKYDVVTAFQVLEHVSAPASFLAAACRLLRPGGRLLIAIPHSAGWLDRAGGVLECPPHHVTRWNGAALQFLAQIFPLVLDHLEIEPMEAGQIPDFVRSIVDPAARLADLTRRRRLRARVAGKVVTAILRGSRACAHLQGVSQLAGFVRRG